MTIARLLLAIAARTTTIAVGGVGTGTRKVIRALPAGAGATVRSG
jgi:hypothetical protein